MLATAGTLAVNVAFRSGALADHVDPTPIVGAVAVTMVSYVLLHQDVLALSPAARALIVDQAGDAVVVLSPSGRVLDVNVAAAELIRQANPGSSAELVGRPAQDLFGAAQRSRTVHNEFALDLSGPSSRL